MRILFAEVAVVPWAGFRHTKRGFSGCGKTGSSQPETSETVRLSAATCDQPFPLLFSRAQRVAATRPPAL